MFGSSFFFGAGAGDALNLSKGAKERVGVWSREVRSL
jgi:hypothetical protein